MAANYTFEDYSGTSNTSKSDNPYDALIEACNNDPHQLQAKYQTHRTTRNAQQKAKLLAPDFPGVTVDEILKNLEDSSQPDYEDWRNCLVLWARPPAAIRSLVLKIQERLLKAAPNLWLMPPSNLHMTALEITHSQTPTSIPPLLAHLQPLLPALASYTLSHRARLVKPALSFDAQALALSFLPAAGEAGRTNLLLENENDAYSYHHLRRDLFARLREAGVEVGSRYVVPSAHLTVGRFVSEGGFEVAELVAAVEEVNGWLEKEVWGKEGKGGEWVVGEERGLEVRSGTLWYGGGRREVIGEGF